MTWEQASALEDVKPDVGTLRGLARDYMAEAGLWVDARMHGALIEAARRLASIADTAIDRTLHDPDHADVVHAFAYAGRLQLDHIQSTRRFAGAEPPLIIPARGGRL